MPTFAEMLADLKTRAAENGRALATARTVVEKRTEVAKQLVIEMGGNVPLWEVADLTGLSRATVSRVETEHGISRLRRHGAETGS